MLEELGGEVVPRPLGARQLHRDLEHLDAVEGHPARRVGLLQAVAGRQRRRAVEHGDVVHAEEAALEQVGAVGVLAVHPPREVEQQLAEHAGEERVVAHAVEAVHVPGRPGVHRWVDVAELPLVGGELAVRVHRPLPAHQHQLLLGELRIDVGQRHGVEGEVPGGEPRVLPLVGHRDDVGERQVRPGGVAGAGGAPIRARRRGSGVAGQPLGDVVAVQLLGPQQPGVRPSGDVTVLGRQVGGDDVVVELVGLAPAVAHDHGEPGAERVDVRCRLRQPQAHGDRLARRHGVERVVERDLGAGVRRVDRRPCRRGRCGGRSRPWCTACGSPRPRTARRRSSRCRRSAPAAAPRRRGSTARGIRGRRGRQRARRSSAPVGAAGPSTHSACRGPTPRCCAATPAAGGRAAPGRDRGWSR